MCVCVHACITESCAYICVHVCINESFCVYIYVCVYICITESFLYIYVHVCITESFCVCIILCVAHMCVQRAVCQVLNTGPYAGHAQ